MELKQFQIVWVNLDPTIGSEMKKTRPCIIISPNEMNKFLNTIVIAPITSSSKNYPTRIAINYKMIKRWVVLDQIRTIDRKRVIKIVDQLDFKEIALIKLIIKETFVE